MIGFCRAWRRPWLWPLVLAIALAACGAPHPTVLPATASPAASLPEATATAPPATATPSPTVTASATASPPPTATPTATPLPTPVTAFYQIRPGDTLIAIARRHGMALDDLLALNGLSADAPIRAGDALHVPMAIDIVLPPVSLLPDSEIVYGRAYLDWETAPFLEAQGGYLATYREGALSGAEIIEYVARKYRIGQRPLLAAIELRSGWVTNPAPTIPSALGLPNSRPPNLFWEATWAARKLAEGYYGQLEGRRDWVTLDSGELARLAPGTNPGSAAVANLLAGATPASECASVLTSGTFEATYRRLFGEIDGGPVLPPDSAQPYFDLPFPEEELWYFTGGPHGGYGDNTSAWAALDFAPPVAWGCWPSKFPVRAVAPGLVVTSKAGEVWVDLDGDGELRTGWVVFYMHLATEGRVAEGTIVQTGDPLGFPSCEGGVAEAAHLHIARLYEGQWMPARGQIPFQLGRWTVTAQVGPSYEGFMRSTLGPTLESCNCRAPRRNRFPDRPTYRGR